MLKICFNNFLWSYLEKSFNLPGDCPPNERKEIEYFTSRIIFKGVKVIFISKEQFLMCSFKLKQERNMATNRQIRPEYIY